MDSVVGLVGENFVLIAADQSAAFSIIRLKDDEDKILPIDSNKLLGAAGETSSRSEFCDLVQKNIHLYRVRNNIQLSVHGTASFIRTMIAENLRKSPLFCDLILGGFDHEGPSMYLMDYLGSLQKTHIAAHGYTSNFLYGLLDNWWKPNLTIEEGVEIIKKCA